MTDKKFTNFEVGDKYDALEHSLDENVVVLGRPLAEQIEAANGRQKLGETVIVTSVDLENKTITIRNDV